MKKYLSIIVISFLTLFVSANAIAALAVSMNPPKSEFDIKPGKKKKEVIEYENRGVKPAILKVYTTGFTIKTNGDLDFTSKRYSAAKWIKAVPDQMKIKPYDYGVVRYEINVPEGTPSGTYTAGVMAEEVKTMTKAKARAAFQLKGRLAHIVYINVGKPNYSVSLGSFTAKQTKDGLKFYISIKNNGKYYFRPKGDIKIYKGKSKIAEVVVPGTPIMRGATRTVVAEPENAVGAGTYTAKIKIDTGGKRELEASRTFTVR